MLPGVHLLAFVITALVIIVVPGPSVMFVISRSLALGRAAGLATVVGNATGVFAQVVAVAFGVGALVERSIAVFTLIKLAGAAYLVFLGIEAVRHRRSLARLLDVSVEPRPTGRILRDAFLVGIANPKAIVFFTAVLPQFVDRAAGDVPGQILLLGAVFFTIALVSDSLWALAAGTVRSWLARSPRRLAALGGVSGLVLVGIGLRLALTGRKD
jgi:threonine/homoserine/homoserine lactone efflux protein